MSVSVSMSGSGAVGLKVGWGEGLPAGGIRASQGTFSSSFKTLHVLWAWTEDMHVVWL